MTTKSTKRFNEKMQNKDILTKIGVNRDFSALESVEKCRAEQEKTQCHGVKECN